MIRCTTSLLAVLIYALGSRGVSLSQQASADPPGGEKLWEKVGPVSPGVLLRQVMGAYETLDTYRDSTELRVRYEFANDMADEAAMQRVRETLDRRQGPMSLTFEKPNRFVAQGADGTRMISDGKRVWRELPQWGQVREESMPAPGISLVDRISPMPFEDAFVMHPVLEILLRPDASFYDIVRPIDQRTVEMENASRNEREGHWVSFDMISAGWVDKPLSRVHVWIDGEDRLIREIRIDQTAYRNAFAQAVREGQSERAPESRASVSVPSYRHFEIVVNFGEVEANIDLSENAFEYEPPEGIEHVEAFDP